MNFASDNTVGASPKVMEAVAAANAGAAPAYGTDDWTARAARLLAEVFDHECQVFLVATGTAANALALGSMAKPWSALFCHETAHVMEDECGAPEFYSNGAKLVGIAGAGGKIAPADFRTALAPYLVRSDRQPEPAALSLSQVSECGTVYDCAEIGRLAEIAHDEGLSVHMDGARFANALVALGVSPAEMTWRAGVDVLSFGATKNGALACEAVVFFDPAKAASFARQRKRGGHTLSKGRFLGAQMVAYLADDHWLDLARHANACAARLSAGLAAAAELRIPWPTQANEVFAILPNRIHRRLQAAGARYHEWSARNLLQAEALSSSETLVRLVCSFATEFSEIDRLIGIALAATEA